MSARHLQALEAEVSVLGAIFLDNAALDRVADGLLPESFHAPRHRAVFGAMRSLWIRGEPIDPVTVADELGQELDALGGMDYLAGLADAAATSVNVEHHAALVVDAAEVRRLIEACEGVARKARAGDYDSNAEILDEAQAALTAVSERRASDGLVPIRTALKAAVGILEAAYANGSAVTGTPSGFAGLDAKTTGHHPGDLVILAARPGMGKTALALGAAVNAARITGGQVVVFSLEMPTAQLAARLIASEARVDSERMRTGVLAQGDIDRILAAVQRLSPLHLHIDDTPAATLEQVRAKCRRLATTAGAPPLKLVVVDYLQLMRGPRQRGGNREQEIAELSRGLKGLAKEMGVPVVALAQLNRGVESRPNKRPQLSDLRESGAIEQDADLVMFCYRDDYYHEDSEAKGQAEIIIGKHRNGSTGTVKLRFAKEWVRFDDLPSESGPARGAWQ